MSSHRDVYDDLSSFITIREDLKMGNYVNPSLSNYVPFDRWFKQKESYSSLLSNIYIEKLNLGENDWVVDPFLGSGSTLVGCKRKGVNGIGMEINPFFYKLALVKLRKYKKIDELRSYIPKFIEKVESTQPPEVPDVAREEDMVKMFGDNLMEVLKIKNSIETIKNPVWKDFFSIGFVSMLDEISYGVKDGNGIRFDRNKKLTEHPLMVELELQYTMMIDDIDEFKDCTISKFSLFNKNSIKFDIHKFSKYIKYYDDLIKNTRLALFSPPYCNCFDYTYVYRTELVMLGAITNDTGYGNLRDISLSSHLRKDYTKPTNLNPELEVVVNQISDDTRRLSKAKLMIMNYFNDINDILLNMDGILSSGGTIACVIGNSSYDTIPIASDLFVANKLLKMDYENVNIDIARTLRTSPQQMKKMKEDDKKYLRESIVSGIKP